MSLIVIGRGAAHRPEHGRPVHRREQPAVERAHSTPHRDLLAAAVAAAGATVRDDAAGKLGVLGLSPAQVGDLAVENGIRLHELAPAQASLEEAFMELTASSVEFHAGLPPVERDAVTAGEVA